MSDILKELGLNLDTPEEVAPEEEMSPEDAGILQQAADASVLWSLFPATSTNKKVMLNLQKQMSSQIKAADALLTELRVRNFAEQEKHLAIGRQQILIDAERWEAERDQREETYLRRVNEIRLKAALERGYIDDSIKQEYKPEKVINQISDAELKKAAARREMQLMNLERENKKLIEQLNELKLQAKVE